MNNVPDLKDWPEGAEYLIDGKYFAKWIDGVEHTFRDCEWHKCRTSWPINKYIVSRDYIVQKRPNPVEQPDNVHKPSHYMIMDGVEFKDVRRALLNTCDEQGTPAWQVDCWSRSFEYIGRMWGKNGLEDAKKARVYLDWLIEAMESEE